MLVFTKSVKSNFRAFWLAPVKQNILGYWFATGAKMASRFETCSKDEIWVKMKKSHKQIPRKRRTLDCQCLPVGRKLFSCWICNKIVKMSLTKFPKCCKLCTKLLPSDVFNFKKLLFFIFIYPSNLVNTKIAILSGSVNSAERIPSTTIHLPFLYMGVNCLLEERETLIGDLEQILNYHV